MFCQSCGRQVQEGLQYCPVCGAPVMSSQNQISQLVQGKNPNQVIRQPGMMNSSGGYNNQMPAAIPQQTYYQQPPRKKNNAPLIAVICCVAALLILSIVLYFVLLSTPTVNLDKYIEIEAEGYNTVGTAKVTFDEDRFYNDCDKKIKYKGEGPSGSKDYYNAAEHLYMEYVNGALDKKDNLSNGDKINYVWDIDEDAVEDYFKIKFKD